MSNWRIVIEPSPVDGDATIQFDEGRLSGFLVENHRKVSFAAPTPQGAVEAIISYGLLTGKLSDEDVHEMCAELRSVNEPLTQSELELLESSRILTAEERATAREVCPEELRQLEEIESALEETRAAILNSTPVSV
jgi:hypothetical protein